MEPHPSRRCTGDQTMNALSVDFGNSEKQNLVDICLAITIGCFITRDIGKRLIKHMGEARLLTQQSVFSDRPYAFAPSDGTIFRCQAFKAHLQGIPNQSSISLSATPFRRSSSNHTASKAMSQKRSTLTRRGLAPPVLPRQAFLRPCRSEIPSECFVASRQNTLALPYQASVAPPVVAGKG